MKDGRRELRLRQMLILGRWVDAGQMLVGWRSWCAAHRCRPWCAAMQVLLRRAGCAPRCAAQVALRGLGLTVLPRLCWRTWALGVL